MEKRTKKQQAKKKKENGGHSKEDLKNLAISIYKGEIFSNFNIRESDMNLMSSIFMPLIFMDKKQFEDFFDDCGMVYEFLSQAGKMAINGYPIFGSVRKLNKEDTDKVLKYYDKMKKLEEEFLEMKGD